MVAFVRSGLTDEGCAFPCSQVDDFRLADGLNTGTVVGEWQFDARHPLRARGPQGMVGVDRVCPIRQRENRADGAAEPGGLNVEVVFDDRSDCSAAALG